jgi:long-chain acyl-CoA synthetase
MTTNYLSILAETIRTNWDAPALTDFYLTEDGTAQDTTRGNHYTYGEMYAEIVRLADYLEQLGLQKGDHIAICGANSAHWVIAYLAIAKMQGIPVTVMHSLMPEQIAALVHFSEAKALFTDEDIWAELQDQSMPQVQTIVSLADWSCLQSTTHRLITDPSPTHHRDISFPTSAPDNLAMICFTSGTSGSAKGVMLSMSSISNNVAYKLHLFSRYV